MNREAIAAGQFYAGSVAALSKQVEGLLDETAEKEKVKGVIVPHAGYLYSGKVAGAVYSRMVPVERFVLIGPNHTGLGKPLSVMTEGSWETPLGKVRIDKHSAEMVISESENLEVGEEAHIYEHSLEVQLPFLQYLKKDFSFVPIILSPASLEVYREIGEAIARVVKTEKDRTVIVASSDMTHYESQDRAEYKDREAIKTILSLDEAEFLKKIKELNLSMCGYAPVIATMVACRELGAGTVSLVQYATSGDVNGDYSSVVGYAGITIK